MKRVLHYEVIELFDPVQTHAAYGVNTADVPTLKSLLKEEYSATRFRVVKTSITNVNVVCFKLKN